MGAPGQDAAIFTSNLTRKFGDIVAVDQLNLNVPSGVVYGFLGPNGSGKTTTIRLLLGLIRPDSGSVRVFDREMSHNSTEVLGRIGSMVEGPSLYGHLTGRENLEINRRLRGAKAAEIDRVLQLTDMTGAAKRLVRHYSLGMKQRLGLALALLDDPKLLVLDEPTNGLDPAGIREVRELLCELPRSTGATVFLSSHLLSEVQQMADYVGILNHGRLLFEGSFDQLQAAQRLQLEIEVGEPDQALTVLQNAGYSVSLIREGVISVSIESRDNSSAVARLLIEHGVSLYQLRRVEASLETLFLNLTESTTEILK